MNPKTPFKPPQAIGYSRIDLTAIEPVGIEREIFTFPGLNADKNQARNPAFINVAAEALTW